MSRPYFSVRHVETMSLLPETLTPGRIYFVDDEQVIVIDHGNGLPPVIYGGKPGPQGSSGTPQANLQEQLDTLAHTSLAIETLLWDEGEKFRADIARLDEKVASRLDVLFDLVNTNAFSMMNLVATVKKTFDYYDSAFATLAKAVSNLYPDDYSAQNDD